MDAFDITDPSAPRFLGASNARDRDGLRSPHDTDLYGDFMVTVDAFGFGRLGGMGKVAVHRIADSATRRLLPVRALGAR